MPWASWINAEIYDRFVRERRIYDRLNRELVRLADLASSRRILDLGCGTGATAEACLREMAPHAELVGVDASREMVGVARANVLDPRARFEVAAAAEVDRLSETFDRVVCNAAFWQFPAARPVFRALARRTAARALFVCNVPAERVVGEDAPVHPFQVSLLREIEAELGRSLLATPVMLDPPRLAATAAECGFTLSWTERFVYEGLQEELMELMAIPAMIRPLTPELLPDQRDAVLSRARERSDPGLRVTVPWIYFVFSRDR
jgi:SAM-dependent methyltransferase